MEAVWVLLVIIQLSWWCIVYTVGGGFPSHSSLPWKCSVFWDDDSLRWSGIWSANKIGESKRHFLEAGWFVLFAYNWKRQIFCLGVSVTLYTLYVNHEASYWKFLTLRISLQPPFSIHNNYDKITVLYTSVYKKRSFDVDGIIK